MVSDEYYTIFKIPFIKRQLPVEGSVKLKMRVTYACIQAGTLMELICECIEQRGEYNNGKVAMHGDSPH